MMIEENFDVVIVGYGPVGAITANFLGMYDLKTAVFESETEAYRLPRAIGFNHEIMRIFQQLGLDKEIQSVATTLEGVEFLDGNKNLLFEVQLKETCLTHGFSPNYVFYQPDLEKKLRLGVERFESITVNLGHTVESIVQDEKSVTVSVFDSIQKRNFQVRAKYVLGCDGARSSTRRFADIKMYDFGFHKSQLVVDTFIKKNVVLSTKLQQLCDTRRPGIFVPSTGNHRRWEFVLEEHETKEEMEKPEKVRELLAKHWLNPDNVQIIRAVVYNFHSLLAEQWRNNRIFLVGDAAHQMPPILGQGMCSGIRDAQNIAWKLDFVFRGVAPEAILDSYQTERLPQVQEIIQTATRLFSIFKTRNIFIAFVRDLILRLLQLLPTQEKLQNMGSDMPPLKYGILANSRNTKQSEAGKLFIQPKVCNYLGEVVLLDEVLGTGFAILGLELNCFELLNSDLRSFLVGLPTKFVCVLQKEQFSDSNALDDSVVLITDITEEIKGWLEEKQGEIVIIRPDRYVFGVYKRENINVAVTDLQLLLVGQDLLKTENLCLQK